ncbi:hypothetical protein DN745_09205 [Bradymonas sediminis]|uniref:non-specific serine/threonine protein kinase n=1 Tax=Bradymonas sediminis TaxID=1548548 RepID=A0A2Z4FLD0_9DELT|nr:hypothetical protein DN745_09205 [Bradymonas sediminis]
MNCGAYYCCALTNADSTLVCWGDDQLPEGDALPAEAFDAVAVGASHTCAIRREDSKAVCWGKYSANSSTARPSPDVAYRAISSSRGYSCGINDDDHVECWGPSSSPPKPLSEKGRTSGKQFLSLSTNEDHACGILDDKTVFCWGNESPGQPESPTSDTFTAVAAGVGHTCAIRESDSKIVCWGFIFSESDEKFSAVVAGDDFTCGIRENDSQIHCWEESSYNITPPPSVRFKSLTAGRSHVCGIRESDSSVECWGTNTYGDVTQGPDSAP